MSRADDVFDKGQPVTPITETPEFKKAVADAVAAAVPDIVARLTAGGATTSADQGFAERLSMAIAQLTDQGTGRRHIAPEVLRAQSAQRKKMLDLILEARIAWSEARARGDEAAMAAAMPTYTLRAKVFLDEVRVDPFWIDSKTHMQMPTQIDWPSVPNEAMIPANDVAKTIFAAFSGSIGTLQEIDRQPEAQYHTTRGGLVVKGPPPRGVPQTGAGSRTPGQPESGEGLRIKHRGDGMGEFKELRVLGTVAQPARQSAG